MLGSTQSYPWIQDKAVIYLSVHRCARKWDPQILILPFYSTHPLLLCNQPRATFSKSPCNYLCRGAIRLPNWAADMTAEENVEGETNEGGGMEGVGPPEVGWCFWKVSTKREEPSAVYRREKKKCWVHVLVWKSMRKESERSQYNLASNLTNTATWSVAKRFDMNHSRFSLSCANLEQSLESRWSIFW